jgi:hypothetical protein
MDPISMAQIGLQGAEMVNNSKLPGWAKSVLSPVTMLMGDSEEEIRRKRQEKLMAENERYRQMALARAQQLKQGGIKDISKETATQLGRAQSDVGRRAAALGRTGDTEAMLLPVTSNINEAGGKNLEGAIQSYDTGISKIGDQYDQNAMNIQSDFAARPIEPGIADNLMSVSSSYIQGNNYDKYLKAMRDINSPSGNVGGLQPFQQQQRPDYSYLNRPYTLSGR